MKPFFKDLFLYNHQCNEDFIAQIESADVLMDSNSMELFSHMLNAHHIWNSRIFEIDRRMEVWQNHPVDKLSKINDENLLNSIQIAEEYELENLITYKNTKGEANQNTVRNILFHIINHSTYHRGQIALLMRQNGITPLSSDFVHKFK